MPADELIRHAVGVLAELISMTMVLELREMTTSSILGLRHQLSDCSDLKELSLEAIYRAL